MDPLILTEGSIFAKRYRIVRRIAHGGMGAVYEVIHVETARHRALKVMLPSLVENDELRERFQLEARVAAHIESVHLVDVFDAGIDEATNVPFLVMALLRGEELGKRLKRVGRFRDAEVVEYLWQVALALDKTHRAHIVHRDLKPENLFLSEQDGEPHRIKVLDFGIAKFVADHGTPVQATRSIGTPLYMAPEQFLPGSTVRPTTDIYALGMIAYTFLVGKPYWDEEKQKGGNVFAFMRAVMFGPTESATIRAQRYNVSLPPAFDTWFKLATAKEPNARFSAATLAITELAKVLGVPIEPGPTRQASLSGSVEDSASYATTSIKSLKRTDPAPIEPATVPIHQLKSAGEHPGHSTSFGLSSNKSDDAQNAERIMSMSDKAPGDGISIPKKTRSTRFAGLAIVGLGMCSATFVARKHGSTEEIRPLPPDVGTQAIPEPSAPLAPILVEPNEPSEIEKAGDIRSPAPPAARSTTLPARIARPPAAMNAEPVPGKPRPIQKTVQIESQDPVRD